MRRWLVLALSMLLVGSVSAVAFADDTTDGDDHVVESTDELNDKQMQRAHMLAAYFAPRLSDDDEGPAGEESEETVGEDAAVEALYEEFLDLRSGDDVVGWGALYKLTLLAEYLDRPLADVVAEFEADGWAFGQALKQMREDDEWQSENDTPRNLGQFKKDQRAERTEPKKKDKKDKKDR